MQEVGRRPCERLSWGTPAGQLQVAAELGQRSKVRRSKWAERNQAASLEAAGNGAAHLGLTRQRQPNKRNRERERHRPDNNNNRNCFVCVVCWPEQRLESIWGGQAMSPFESQQ